MGEKRKSVVEEAPAAYLPAYAAVGLPCDLKSLFSDKLLLVAVIGKGLSFECFEYIAALFPFTEEEWASYLQVSHKSLQRYRLGGGHTFKPAHAERMLSMAEVAVFGIEVFGTKERFHRWLQSPTLALGGHSPAALLRDSYGKELVMEELGRIEHGIFA